MPRISGWVLFFVGTGGDVVDGRGEGLVAPEVGHGGVVGLEQGLLGLAGEGAEDEGGEVAAGVDGLGGGVGGAGHLGGEVDGLGRVVGKSEGDGCEAHEGAVAGGVGVGAAGIGVAVAVEADEGGADCIADVEALAVAREVAFVEPAAVAAHLVGYARGMAQTVDRVLLHLADGSRRPVGPQDVYLLEAEGGETAVRTRSASPLLDVRPLGELLPLFEPWGFVRIHRSFAVNASRIRSIRPRSSEGWEVKLDPPVNRVLPLSRDRKQDLWAVFRD